MHGGLSCRRRQRRSPVGSRRRSDTVEGQDGVNSYVYGANPASEEELVEREPLQVRNEPTRRAREGTVRRVEDETGTARRDVSYAS